jgi:hypothetical protein
MGTLLFVVCLLVCSQAFSANPVMQPPLPPKEPVFTVTIKPVSEIVPTKSKKISPYEGLNWQERDFFQILNYCRKKQGFESLTPDDNLMQIARYWAVKGTDRHEQSGHDGKCIAGVGDPKAAFILWQQELGTKYIMFDKNYKYAGIGFDRRRAVLLVSYEPWEHKPYAVKPWEIDTKIKNDKPPAKSATKNKIRSDKPVRRFFR